MAGSFCADHWSKTSGLHAENLSVKKTDSKRTDRRCVLLLLKSEEKTVGYTAYEEINGKIYLSKLYLLNKVRGQGLTSSVFRWYEELAAQTKEREIFLRVNQGNHQAIEVYKHEGFEITEELISDIGQGFQMVDYKMKKALA